MKSIYFTAFLIFATSIQNIVDAQIISNTINKKIACCSSPPGVMYSDSVDINADNVYEVKITSMYGLDNLYYYAQGMNGTQISGCNALGAPFTVYGYASMPQTPIGPTWTGWLPNSGFKYLGFRKINAPSDTTFGWMKVNFVGNPSGPLDTIKIVQYAYNSTPNVHLNAGQLIFSSISELNLETGISIFPSITIDNISIENKLSKTMEYHIYNVYGQLVNHGSVNEESLKSIDVSNLQNGLYFVNVDIEGKHKVYKVIKN